MIHLNYLLLHYLFVHLLSLLVVLLKMIHFAILFDYIFHLFKYKDNRSKLVDDLLQNYKVKPKR